ncbi:MAG: hypothetical protein ABXS91_08605 [Sulfurimonas sp.]
MKYQFDQQTGFLVTRAMSKLMDQGTKEQNIHIDASQSNSNNKTIINEAKARRRPKAAKAKSGSQKTAATTTAANNKTNQYYVDKNSISNNKNGIFDSIKAGAKSYLDKRNEKKSQAIENKENKQQQEQTETLKDIREEIKKGDGGGSGTGGSGTLPGIGRAFKFGAIGGIVGGMFKGLATRLGIPAVIYAVLDNYEEAISRFKSSIGKNKEDSLTITEKLRFVVNQVGRPIVSFANSLGADIDPELIGTLTANMSEAIHSKFNNLKTSYPRFGQSVEDIFTFTDRVLGEATDYIGDGFEKLGDLAKEAFRDKDKIEAAYLKAKSEREEAQSIVDMTGDGKVLFGLVQAVSEEEINARKDRLKKAKAKEAELAKKMLKSGGTMSVKTEAEAVMSANRTTLDENRKRAARNAPKYEKKTELSDKAIATDQTLKIVRKQKTILEKISETDSKNREYYKDNIRALIEEEKRLVGELGKIRSDLSGIAIEEIVPLPYNLKSDAATVKATGNDLLGLISKGEGTTDADARKHGYKSGYDVTLGYGAYANGRDRQKPVSEMRISEVREMQMAMLSHPDNKLNSSAVGKYQVVSTTLDEAQRSLGLSDDAVFDKETQDKVGMFLLKRRGYEKYKKGEITEAKFQKNLSREWDSLAMDESNLTGGRKKHTAKVKNKEIDTVLASIKSKAINVVPMSPLVKKDSTAPAERVEKQTKTEEKTVKFDQQQSVVAQLFDAPIFDEMAKTLKRVESNTRPAPGKAPKNTEEITVNIVNKSTGTTVGGQV